MAVRWDSVLARAVALELDRRLRGRRCRAYSLDEAHRTVWLFMDDLCLEVRLDPADGSLLAHPAAEPYSESVSLSAEVLGVSSPPDERRVVMSFQRRRGRSRRIDLVLEWAANRRNAVFVSRPEGRVTDALPYRGPGTGGLGRGALYPEPPPPDRGGLDGTLDDEAWSTVSTDRRTLLRGLAWTSPINAEALLSDPGKGQRLWETLANPDDTKPGVLETPRGPQPYPRPLPGHDFHPSTDVLAAFRDALALSAQQNSGQDGPGHASAPVDPEALRRLDERETALDRELGSMRRALENTVDPAVLRGFGDLLLSRISELRRGLESVRLTGFDGDPVDLTLDPSLEPHENADRYYRDAGKAERARATLPGRIERLERQKESLRALRERLEAGSAGLADVPEWPRSVRGAGPVETGPSRPYRVYRTSGGLEVRLGRGARFNDDLTFRNSRPDDIWLHARDSAGAHVILRWTARDNPPARDLEQAAALAALHSRSRHSDVVPVDWTRRKYVRKPRGAPPGAVVPDRVKTLFVSPDDAPDPHDSTDLSTDS